MKPFLYLSLFLPLVAQAQLAYDGFRPETGYNPAAGGKGALNDQALQGPKGWAGKAWEVPGPKGSNLFQFREDAALDFPAVTYPGGGGTEIRIPDALMRTRGRNLSEPLNFAGRTAFYMSFLVRVEGQDCGGTALAAFENSGGNNLGLGAGIHGGNLVLLGREAKGERVFIGLGQAEPQKTYYLVIKLSDRGKEWRGPDDLEIWVNPTDVTSEDKATQTAEIHLQDPGNHNGAAEFGIGRLMLQVENFPNATVRFDEFALGETFESVTTAVKVEP